MTHDADAMMDDADLVGSDEDIALIDRDDISNYNPDNILPESKEWIDQIRAWLDPTSYDLDGGEYRKHLNSHLRGTGRWLSETDAYNRWHDDEDNGLLWIKGIPGSGKSVFAAAITDQLAEEGHPVLYFFFRQIIDANHKPANLLRDWLDQVLEYSPPLQQELKAYLDTRSRSAIRPLDSISLQDLWKHLKTALSHIPRVYLVADALDEMDGGNDRFLAEIAELGLWKPSQVKVLITSRPVPAVETPLYGIPASQIRLEERFVDTDISTFVRHNLKLSSISEPDRQLITAAIPGRANGLFLYARLAMDAFLEPNADVDQVLKALPADLNTMYTDLLREHARRSAIPHDIQLLILSWVTHATRPLRLLEMAEVIKVTYDRAAMMDTKSVKSLVRSACGPLLEILPDETISVVHHSLTEFLTDKTRLAEEEKSTAFPILLPGPTHEQLSLACLRYLQSGCLDNIVLAESDEEDRYSDGKLKKRHNASRLQFPFLEYSAKNWTVHARKSDSVGWGLFSILPTLDDFFGDAAKVTAWLDIQWRPRATKGVSTAHIAAAYGLSQYVERIHADGNQIDCLDVRKQTPLSYAALNGHHETVKILIDGGANPDQGNDRGLKPLHHAASRNHAGVVSVLLAAGVDALTPKTTEDPGNWCGNAPRSTGHTPLMYACKAGHMEAVEAFLPHLTDSAVVHRALDWASRAGKSKLVKRLILHPGVDINQKTRGDTALFNAASQRDLESMEALLQAGADVSILCRWSGEEYPGGGGSIDSLPWGSYDDGTIPTLKAFCSSSRSGRRSVAYTLDSDEIKHGFDLLVNAGADINRRSSSKKTPLHDAANDPVLLRLLIQAGADPNAEDDDGGTLLHTPLGGEEGWQIVKLLVEEGRADINKRRGRDDFTPLLAYVSSITSGDNTLRFIEELGPDCTVSGKDGESVLHIAVARTCRRDVVQLIDKLIEGGARIDQKNAKGEMPIHVAKEMSAIEQLVAHGADLESQDHNGATTLMRWSHNGFFGGMRDAKGYSALERLLDLGARPNTRDLKGRTLLHQAVSHIQFDRWRPDPFHKVEFFLGKGLDVRSVDDSGDTLLHELVKSNTTRGSGFQDVFRKLVELGVDPDQANCHGRTVLHLIFSTPEDFWLKMSDASSTQLALEICKNIDAEDEHGVRPIHMACISTEDQVWRLMGAGANICAPTHQGFTPLHVASLTRKSNIVGVLCDAVATGDHGAPAGIIDARDKDQRTALYYACRSGRPETVNILLKAGAEVEQHSSMLLDALLDFEPEDEWWKKGGHSVTISDIFATRFRDKRRPTADDTTNVVHNPKPEHLGARLAEIIQLLIDNGLDLGVNNRYLGPHLANVVDHAISQRKEYTAELLLQLQEENGETMESDAEDEPRIMYSNGNARKVFEFEKHWATLRRATAGTALRDYLAADNSQSMESQEAIVESLLMRREFASVIQAFGLGFEIAKPNNDGITALHRLVDLGLDGILAQVAVEADVKNLDSHDWCQEQENMVKVRKGTIIPSVLRACQRELPNMPILRVLIENLNASIDATHRSHEYVSSLDTAAYQIKGSPLHWVARGQHWWHVNEALPYLIAQGAELNIQDSEGNTPLHKALDDGKKADFVHCKQAARVLIAAGADVNNVNEQGESCLARAGDDKEVIHLLINNGAKITASALFSALNKKNATTLEVLLSNGTDPNLRPEPRPEPILSREQKIWLKPGRIKDHEKYPLYHAATISTGDNPEVTEGTVANLVRVLLSHGADPFAKFKARAPEDEKEQTEEGEELTVLHEVLFENGVIGPFFELPTLNLEHRNARGQTLLLAACVDDRVLDRFIIVGNDEPKMLVEVLLERGADVSATDIKHRNALHLAYTSVRHNRFHSYPEKNSLKVLASAHPGLVQQADIEGKTPLHYALQSATKGLISVDKIDELLEAGANPHASDINGNTALHYLAEGLMTSKSCFELWPKFLALGLDVNAPNETGRTPILHYYHSEPDFHDLDDEYDEDNHHKTAWELFEEAGVDFTVRDYRGRSLLHTAAMHEPWIELFEKLVAKGLDPLSEDDEQQSSLDVAAACGNRKVLALFERSEQKKATSR